MLPADGPADAVALDRVERMQRIRHPAFGAVDQRRGQIEVIQPAVAGVRERGDDGLALRLTRHQYVDRQQDGRLIELRGQCMQQTRLVRDAEQIAGVPTDIGAPRGRTFEPAVNEGRVIRARDAGEEEPKPESIVGLHAKLGARVGVDVDFDARARAIDIAAERTRTPQPGAADLRHVRHAKVQVLVAVDVVAQHHVDLVGCIKEVQHVDRWPLDRRVGERQQLHRLRTRAGQRRTGLTSAGLQPQFRRGRGQLHEGDAFAQDAVGERPATTSERGLDGGLQRRETRDLSAECRHQLISTAT